MSKQSTGSNESVTNAMSNSGSAGTVTETCCSETPSSTAPFSTRLPIATKKSLKPSPETIKAAAKFEENGCWTVEISNWEAALLALADDRHSFYYQTVGESRRTRGLACGCNCSSNQQMCSYGPFLRVVR